MTDRDIILKREVLTEKGHFLVEIIPYDALSYSIQDSEIFWYYQKFNLGHTRFIVRKITHLELENFNAGTGFNFKTNDLFIVMKEVFSAKLEAYKRHFGRTTFTQHLIIKKHCKIIHI